MMPFGLTNALAAFMCLINQVFSAYQDKFMVIFIYDILVYSKDRDDNEEHLQLVLQTLREHKLRKVVEVRVLVGESVVFGSFCL